MPHILFVDDDERANPRQISDTLAVHSVEGRLRTPEEALLGDLRWADLVVVDYFLSNWPERDTVASTARSPQNGLAAAASMRSLLLPDLRERQKTSQTPRPVAFALWSGNLREAAFDLPEVVLPHVFARENNLEWAFRREDFFRERGAAQVALLAKAVRGLPAQWPVREAEAENQMMGLLGLDARQDAETETSWQLFAKREVLACRPPIHELSARSHGLAFVRWLLHRIYPYPCFLLDELQLRARLRVDNLASGPVHESPLFDALRPYEYTGTMSGFLGRRWWRAGIEQWLYEVTDGESGFSPAVSRVAENHGATSRVHWRQPVVVIGGNLARQHDLVEVDEVVRVLPDDWPVFADPCYARISDALEDPALRALVDPSDRDLLEPESPA